jgi:hypothetical protein
MRMYHERQDSNYLYYIPESVYARGAKINIALKAFYKI